MKKLTPEVEDRLRRKRISIVDYIFRLREGRKMTITQMAEKMKVKVAYLSRILGGAGSNVTLETIAKCEDALDADILVCPGEYEERLIDKPERLWLIFSTALKTESAPYLIRSVAANNTLRMKALLWDHNFDNGVFVGKSIFSDSRPQRGQVILTTKDENPKGEFTILAPTLYVSQSQGNAVCEDSERRLEFGKVPGLDF